MKSIISKIFLIFVGVFTGVLLFFVLDAVFGLFYPQSLFYKKSLFSEPPVSPFGFHVPRSNYGQVRETPHGEVLWDVEYGIERYGRRIVPQRVGEKNRVALFFGGSNTFGDGLSDSESVPSQFAIRNPNYEVYNYAHQGWGPQQMLVRLREGFADGEILDRRGFAFYMFYNFHVKRVVGTSHVIRWSGGRHPYFKINEKGELERDGFHATARPISNFLIGLFFDTHIFRHFGVEYPKLRQEHFDLTCKVFSESKKRLEKLHIKLLAYSTPSFDSFEEINRCMDEDLKVRKMPGTVEIAKSYVVPQDGHLNRKGAEAVGLWLSETVRSISLD